MDVILAPDVYVNASVALGSPPDQVVQRILGKHKGQSGTTEWILGRVSAMLGSIPEFKQDAVDQQVGLIKTLVNVHDGAADFGPEAWEEALAAAADAAGATRVITDHPDLLEKDDTKVEFVSTEAWLLEQQMPPPPPPAK
ncbi:MAG: hypothetical protein AAGF12_20220 [Myxococcota bacterium]